MKKILKKLVPLVGMCCLSVSGGAAEPIAEQPTEKDFRVGDFWKYSSTENRADGVKVKWGDHKYTVVAVENGDVVLDPYMPYSEHIYPKKSTDDRRRNLVKDEQGRKGVWRDWPLAVGKTWRFLEAYRIPTFQAVITVQDVAVTAYEEVEVPAGKFWAFKIEYRGGGCTGCGDYFGGVIRKSTELELDRIENETRWYAPEVKADVKSVHHSHSGSSESVWELVEYSRPR